MTQSDAAAVALARDGDSDAFRSLVEHCLNDAVPGRQVAQLLKPDEEDYFVLKPKNSAFFGTTLDTLLKPENKAMLRRVLTYHVVSGKVLAADVVKLTSAKTVSGDTVGIQVNGGTVMLDKARVVKTDISTSNGVIHVIDSVLLPPAR